MFAKYYCEESENKQFIRKQTIYLVLLNANTRDLIVLPVEDKTQQNYIKAIKNHFKNKLIDTGKYKQWTGPKGGKYKKIKPDNEQYINKSGIKTIKGDGEFDTNEFT